MMMNKSNERPLGEIIREVLKHHRLDNKLCETRIRFQWTRLMGPHIDRYTDKVTMQGTQLTIYLRSSVLRNELGFAREEIMEKLNKALGERMIQDIVFM